MTNSQKAQELAHALEAATRIASGFYYPHVKEWLKIQVRLENLTQQEANQEFHFDEITEQTIDFQSENWEETWSYGGHELHYGNTIQIPFGFFDDATPYLKIADDHEAEKERQKILREKRTKRDTVRELEAKLKKARKEAEL